MSKVCQVSRNVRKRVKRDFDIQRAGAWIKGRGGAAAGEYHVQGHWTSLDVHGLILSAARCHSGLKVAPNWAGYHLQ